VRVLVTGASGQVGSEIIADLQRRKAESRRGPSLELVAADHSSLDVADRDAVLAAIGVIQPEIIIHAAAWTAVDGCEGDPDRAYGVNSLGTRHI